METLIVDPAGVETLVKRYRDRTPRSEAIGARAERVMPAGDTRAAGYHEPYPLTLVSGRGEWLRDLDDHEYLDLSYNYTSLVHGHAYGPIVDAVEATHRDGTAWPARSEPQIELAELLVDRLASVDQVRFANSGTEAAMLAMHVARIATGRPKVLMARCGYHGSHEYFDVGAHDGAVEIPGAEDGVLTAEYGDAADFERVLAEHGSDIAAVFLEPVMGSGGIRSASPEFLAAVRRATTAAGALLVLDEVITFRLGTGGAQAALGVTPDLTLLGKLIGGGYPVGAVGGRADLMAILDPRRGRYLHSGTFNGNRITAVAGAVSVRELTAARIDTMASLAADLDDGLRRLAARHGVPLTVSRAGSLLNLFVTSEVPRPGDRPDGPAMAALHLAGLLHGLHFPARGMLVVSTLTTPATITEALARFDAAFADLTAIAA
ncbi:MAG: aminotransferase class III-fold pyridoxal phosphate-dependent enzyme [Actinomycetota bacterium]|nr:aminotransferase class III-fold pyridoxal phosphate-dependent enzyme [Actinomycetota bacterium]